MDIDIYKQFGLMRIVSDNPKKFTSLVFLFDRNDFLEEIKKIRVEIGLNPLNLYSRDEVVLVDRTMPNVSGYTKHLKTDDVTLLEIFKRADEKARKLIETYSRTPNYILPITMAIITGVVLDEDITFSPEFRIIMPGRYKNDSNVPELSMVFYPETSIEEIKKVFEEEKAKLFAFYQYRFFKNKKNKYDTISNINRDRYVYWLRQSNLSWKNLQNFITPIFGDVSTRGLQLSLQRYKDGLK